MCVWCQRRTVGTSVLLLSYGPWRLALDDQLWWQTPSPLRYLPDPKEMLSKFKTITVEKCTH